MRVRITFFFFFFFLLTQRLTLVALKLTKLKSFMDDPIVDSILVSKELENLVSIVREFAQDLYSMELLLLEYAASMVNYKQKTSKKD